MKQTRDIFDVSVMVKPHVGLVGNYTFNGKI